jgi:hypothetical protein
MKELGDVLRHTRSFVLFIFCFEGIEIYVHYREISNKFAAFVDFYLRSW